MTESYFTSDAEINIPTSTDVRNVFRIFGNSNASAEGNSAAFDLWLAQVQIDAVAAATAEIRAVAFNEAANKLDQDAHTASVNAGAIETHYNTVSRYREGLADGITNAATAVHRMAYVHRLASNAANADS